VVEGAIGEGTLNLPRDYRRARALTRHPMKITLTADRKMDARVKGRDVYLGRQHR
jgi:hypothetical protein